ncbi:hypothetical protein CPLU01_02281 [Colletotrichum plurivorum]|uniref:Uncharacterized protein n=1 Tax=Colletotrichum plurivorum TaxID=2175906 RepID=A0A8H6KX28_9PEZI|nr:hypothetical protein CPLU01_02281 [Colletotrichum plurivorum]
MQRFAAVAMYQPIASAVSMAVNENGLRDTKLLAVYKLHRRGMAVGGAKLTTGETHRESQRQGQGQSPRPGGHSESEVEVEIDLRPFGIVYSACHVMQQTNERLHAQNNATSPSQSWTRTLRWTIMIMACLLVDRSFRSTWSRVSVQPRFAVSGKQRKVRPVEAVRTHHGSFTQPSRNQGRQRYPPGQLSQKSEQQVKSLPPTTTNNQAPRRFTDGNKKARSERLEFCIPPPTSASSYYAGMGSMVIKYILPFWPVASPPVLQP